MLIIKTISEKVENSEKFDERVNNALADGWDLNSNQAIAVGSDIMLHAQLSKYEEDEEENDEEYARWETTRDPAHPFRCSSCKSFADTGNAEELPHRCPLCDAIML